MLATSHQRSFACVVSLEQVRNNPSMPFTDLLGKDHIVVQPARLPIVQLLVKMLQWTLCSSFNIWKHDTTENFSRSPTISSQIWHLFLGLGTCYGWGSGFLYITATPKLGQWVSHKRSLVIGIASSRGRNWWCCLQSRCWRRRAKLGRAKDVPSARSVYIVITGSYRVCCFVLWIPAECLCCPCCLRTTKWHGDWDILGHRSSCHRRVRV